MAIKELREATSPKANKEILDVSRCFVLSPPPGLAVRGRPSRGGRHAGVLHFLHRHMRRVTFRVFFLRPLVGLRPSQAFSCGEDWALPFCSPSRAGTSLSRGLRTRSPLAHSGVGVMPSTVSMRKWGPNETWSGSRGGAGIQPTVPLTLKFTVPLPHRVLFALK